MDVAVDDELLVIGYQVTTKEKIDVPFFLSGQRMIEKNNKQLIDIYIFVNRRKSR